MNMQQYERYKDSQDAWLGRVPAGWEVRRADFVIKSRKLQISDGDLENMDVYHYAIPTVQTTGVGAIEEGESINSNKLIINEPQVLVSKLNPRKATVTIAEPHDEYLTVASTEFVPLIPYDSEIRYLYYVWKSQKVTDRLSSFVQSVTRSHQRCEPAEITKIPWAWPTLNEQSCIADFLDRKTAEIDTLIAKKRRLLDLLAEKRTALITRAVTKGLNPDAPMKDSGIEWLGKIPAHWEVLPVKRLVYEHDGLQMGPYGSMLTNLPGNGTGYKLYGQENVISGDFSRGNRWIDEGRYEVLERYRVLDGDLVLTRKGSLGNCRIVPYGIIPGIIDSDTIRVRPCKDILLSEWALLSLQQSAYVSEQIAMMKRGAILSGLNTSVVGSLLLVVPPKLEQKEVLKNIKGFSAAIEKQNNVVTKTIAALQEYRSALITNAVTGQIKVA